MTDFNKLADAPNSDAITRAAEILEGYAEFIKAEQGDNLERHPYIPDIEDAARILRAAGAADVAGLIAKLDQLLVATYEDGVGDTRGGFYSGCATPLRLEFESALRVAMAPKAGFVMVPIEPTQAMLAAATNYSAQANIANGLGYYRAMIAASQAGAAQEPKP